MMILPILSNIRPINETLFSPPGNAQRLYLSGAPQNNDRHRNHGRPVANPVEHRLGSYAPHRRTDVGRHGVVNAVDVDRHSSTLMLCVNNIPSTNNLKNSKVKELQFHEEPSRMSIVILSEKTRIKNGSSNCF